MKGFNWAEAAQVGMVVSGKESKGRKEKILANYNDLFPPVGHLKRW